MTHLLKYQIDADDRITRVNSAWLDFAQENDGGELSEDRVVGQRIWRFIAGSQVRSLYRELFADLRREHQEVLLPFRCDSPETVRHMEMTLRSAPCGGIDFESRMVRATDRESVTLLARRSRRSDEQLPICSFCRRLMVGDEWLPVQHVLVRRRWFGAVSVPRLAEALCPNCLRTARITLP